MKGVIFAIGLILMFGATDFSVALAGGVLVTISIIDWS